MLHSSPDKSQNFEDSDQIFGLNSWDGIYVCIFIKILFQLFEPVLQTMLDFP